MNFLHSVAERRVLPRPLESVRDPADAAAKLCNRPVRIIQAAVAVPGPPAAHLGGGGWIQPTPRICLGIPTASRQGERYETIICTRAHEPEILEILNTPN